jgi:hypothetical protein
VAVFKGILIFVVTFEEGCEFAVEDEGEEKTFEEYVVEKVEEGDGEAVVVVVEDIEIEVLI